MGSQESGRDHRSNPATGEDAHVIELALLQLRKVEHRAGSAIRHCTLDAVFRHRVDLDIAKRMTLVRALKVQPDLGAVQPQALCAPVERIVEVEAIPAS